MLVLYESGTSSKAMRTRVIQHLQPRNKTEFNPIFLVYVYTVNKMNILQYLWYLQFTLKGLVCFRLDILSFPSWKEKKSCLLLLLPLLPPLLRSHSRFDYLLIQIGIKSRSFTGDWRKGRKGGKGKKIRPEPIPAACFISFHRIKTEYSPEPTPLEARLQPHAVETSIVLISLHSSSQKATWTKRKNMPVRNSRCSSLRSSEALCGERAPPFTAVFVSRNALWDT